MKFGVCAIIKNENLYLREWIEYHLDIGFDKIIIYDNNDIDGENPQSIIQDYISTGQVELINYRGVKGNECYYSMQTDAYNECILNHKNTDYWIAFIDCDEFIFIEKYKTIKHLFNIMPYNNFDCVLLNWCNYGDNGQLYYKDEKVQNRFTKKSIDFPWCEGYSHNTLVKSIAKPSADIMFTLNNSHCPSHNCCIATGEYFETNNSCNKISVITHNIIYVKHYYTKSLTEFLYRKLTQDPAYFKHGMRLYKAANEWTEEHEKVYQNFIKQNNITL